MKLFLEPAKTFGELIYLGNAEKFTYVNGNRTDILEGYNCKLGCEKSGEQIVALVPPTVAVDEIKFGQRVKLGGEVTSDPYGNSAKDSTFAEVRMRFVAETILDAVTAQNPNNPNPGNKPGEKKLA